MEYIDKAFVDTVVYLDGNTFIRCSFEGCELRYNGGSVRFDDMQLKTENRFTYGPGVDAFDNPVSRFLIAGMEAQGATRINGEPPRVPPIPPKKDLG